MSDFYTFGNEDLSHITDEMFIKMWMKIQSKEEDDPCTMAENSITEIDLLIKQNKKNINYKTLDSETASIFTENGWEIKPVDEIIDMVIKKRSQQLFKFKHLVDF